MSSAVDEREEHDEELLAAPDTYIPLSDPDVTLDDLAAVESVMRSSRLSNGPVVAEFEAAFAFYLRRKFAVATSSGTSGLHLALLAHGIGPGDEVIASSHSFRETQHAIALCGAHPVFVDIDYWSGTIAATKVEAAITERTRAIVASNTNGHPAPWDELKEIAKRKRILILEDSTEALGSKYKNRLVGTFGASSVFDFSQPGPLVCGEGGVVVTDDIDVAVALRRLRAHRHDERASVVVSSSAPYQVGMSDITAALALSQLNRLDEILEKRKLIEHYYFKHIKSFSALASAGHPEIRSSRISRSRRSRPRPTACRCTPNDAISTSAIIEAHCSSPKKYRTELSRCPSIRISRRGKSSSSSRR